MPSAIGSWCNGSTTDSDSVCLGSKPSDPTKRAEFQPFFHELALKTFGSICTAPYFCTPKKELGYGVTVALQILILSVLVRIQVTQLNDQQMLVVFVWKYFLAFLVSFPSYEDQFFEFQNHFPLGFYFL